MVLGQGRLEQRLVVEQLTDLVIGGIAQGTNEDRGRNLTGLVDADEDDIVGVGLELEPGTPVRDHGRPEGPLVGDVERIGVVDARRAYQLADDHPLGAVDHEGALLGHGREVTHEDLLLLDLLDLAAFLGDQPDSHL